MSTLTSISYISLCTNLQPLEGAADSKNSGGVMWMWWNGEGGLEWCISWLNVINNTFKGPPQRVALPWSWLYKEWPKSRQRAELPGLLRFVQTESKVSFSGGWDCIPCKQRDKGGPEFTWGPQELTQSQCKFETEFIWWILQKKS